MKIKIKDFVEIEYTGKLKEDNTVFDTTNEEIAKENNLFNKNFDYGPVVVCVGQEQVLRGIDNALIGKEAGKEYKVELKPKEAFGNKDAKLIQLMPTNKFSQQKIQPIPGLQVNIDGVFGIVKTVSGGRTLVDFNHPLAGKEISYDVKINRMVNDDKEKIKAYLKIAFGIKDCEVAIENENAKIKMETELDKKSKEEVNKKITEIVPTVKKLEFVIIKERKK